MHEQNVPAREIAKRRHDGYSRDEAVVAQNTVFVVFERINHQMRYSRHNIHSPLSRWLMSTRLWKGDDFCAVHTSRQRSLRASV